MAFERIAIIGAGAIGASLGALLARAGREVQLVGRGDSIKAIQASGLRVEGALGAFTASVKASETIDSAPDLAFLAVKTQDVAEALRRHAPGARKRAAGHPRERRARRRVRRRNRRPRTRRQHGRPFRRQFPRTRRGHDPQSRRAGRRPALRGRTTTPRGRSPRSSADAWRRRFRTTSRARIG